VRAFGLRLGGLALFGLALRVPYTLLFAGDATGPTGDIMFFHNSANLLAEGTGYVAPYAVQFEGVIRPTAEHPPLWPLVLAASSKLGASGYVAHRLVGCLIGAVVIVVVGLLGRRAGGERVGLIAAGLAALYPVLIGADGSLMSETLYGLGIAAALLAGYRLLEEPSPRRAAVLGATIALAALTRGEALILLPLLAGPLAWRGGAGRWRRVAAATLAAATVIAPWTARNFHALDRPVLISLNDSTVLVGANCDETYSGSDLGFWRDDCRSAIRESNEADLASRYRQEGIEYALDHAGRLPVVTGTRVLRTWNLYQPLRQVDFAEGRHRRMEQAGVVAFFLLAPLAVWGTFLQRRRRQPLWILLCPVVLVTITSVVAYGYPRFRHAAEVPLVVLAAVALGSLSARGSVVRSEEVVRG